MTTARPLSEDRRAASLRALLPYLLLALASLFWAGNWVVGRAIREAMPPVALNFWRWAVAMLILAPIALPRLRGKGEVIRRRWPILLLLGATGIALFQLLVYTGLSLTTTVNAVLMNSAAPLFIILVAWRLERQRVTARQLLGVAVSFLGIVIIMNRGNLATLRQFALNPGDMIILLAMPVWGLYSVLLQRRPSELDGIALLFVIGVIGVALLAPAYVIESLVIRPAQLTWAAAAAVLYVALFASLGAYICWNRGVALVGPNRSGFTIHLLPAFGTVLAVIFLGEDVHLFHAIGIAVILFGVWLATSARGSPDRA